MTDREKLIGLLQTSPMDIMGNHPVGSIADWLIANGVTFQRWIPVTESLPESDELVLLARCYRQYRYVEIGKIIGGEAYCYSDVYKINRGAHKLTHWMPLPEPPSGERKDDE